MTREMLARYRDGGRLVHAAMYLRKSRAEEHMSLAETLARHKQALMSYAFQYGFSVAPEDTYEEVVSGESLFARPQMLHLMEAVTAGKYEAVLCMDMQRLGRGGMYDQGFILDTFKDSETLIVTLERVYDLTKEMDEQAAEMETFMSRGEYRLIVKRLHRGIDQSVKNGGYVSNPPFGYKSTKIGRLPSLEIVPDEAECVRQIYQMYAAGNGATTIERMVTAMGFHGRRGSFFNRNTIRNILSNPVYVGDICWHRSHRVKTGVGADRKVTLVQNDPEDVEYYKGIHQPIISRELWDTVQEIRKSKYKRPNSRPVASPLAGLIRCSQCGRLTVMGSQSKGVPYLLCQTKGCSAAAKYEFVERAVLNQLEAMANGIEIDLARAVRPDTKSLELALEKIRAQIVKLSDRRNRLYTLLEDGTYTREIFSQRMQLLGQEDDKLKAAAQDLEAEIRTARGNNAEKQLARIRTVLAQYQSASLADRKTLLHSIIEEIQYTKMKKTKPADFTLQITLRTFL